jgi:hypothetical protein
MKNIEDIIFDKISNKLSFKKLLMPSIIDEDVRTKCFDLILLPIMNQIVFNSTRSLVSGIKSKIK